MDRRQKGTGQGGTIGQWVRRQQRELNKEAERERRPAGEDRDVRPCEFWPLSKEIQKRRAREEGRAWS